MRVKTVKIGSRRFNKHDLAKLHRIIGAPNSEYGPTLLRRKTPLDINLTVKLKAKCICASCNTTSIVSAYGEISYRLDKHGALSERINDVS